MFVRGGQIEVPRAIYSAVNDEQEGKHYEQVDFQGKQTFIHQSRSNPDHLRTFRYIDEIPPSEIIDKFQDHPVITGEKEVWVDPYLVEQKYAQDRFIAHYKECILCQNEQECAVGDKRAGNWLPEPLLHIPGKTKKEIVEMTIDIPEHKCSMRPRFGRLIIKRFNAGELPTDQVERDLEELKEKEKFIPAVVVIDHADEMTDAEGDLQWQELGSLFKRIRGKVAGKHNLLAISATQCNAEGNKAKRPKMHNVFASWNKTHPVDIWYNFGQTEDEEKRGVAVIQMSKGRLEKKWNARILQSYLTGQFCLHSKLDDGDDGEEGAKDQVMELLNQYGETKTQKWIADHVGCSAAYVSAVKKEWKDAQEAQQVPEPGSEG
jgi:hypothetical protein